MDYIFELIKSTATLCSSILVIHGFIYKIVKYIKHKFSTKK